MCTKVVADQTPTNLAETPVRRVKEIRSVALLIGVARTGPNNVTGVKLLTFHSLYCISFVRVEEVSNASKRENVGKKESI